MFEAELRNLLSQVSTSLAERGWKMATAESCTGGWIAKCCTDLPGSSEWFERGFVTYSNEAKQDMLGVSADTLARFGAVSEETAREMAEGALRHSRAQASLAVTGIAGPSGGTPDKPVGTVVFAWAVADGGTTVERQRFEGDRRAVRQASVERALAGLLARLRRT